MGVVVLIGTHQDHILELNQQIKLLQSEVSELKEQNDKQCLNYQDQFRIKNEEIMAMKTEKRQQDEHLKSVKEAAIKKVDQPSYWQRKFLKKYRDAAAKESSIELVYYIPHRKDEFRLHKTGKRHIDRMSEVLWYN